MSLILQTNIPEQDAILREESMPVPDELFGTPELRAMLSDMEETLDAASNGVALAAPQIGLLWRIFIVRYDRMLSPSEEENSPPLSPEVGIFINPVISRTSQRKLEMDEGCLSVHTHFGKTKRFERATVQAYDEKGNLFERGGGGILAQAFQHEIDHLNGMLFIDHATNLVTSEEYRAHRDV
ncbi:MAG: peptide deformylase [Patescibacteria group bacterium]